MLLNAYMQEDESNNVLSLGENISKLFEDHFGMRDVTYICCIHGL